LNPLFGVPKEDKEGTKEKVTLFSPEDCVPVPPNPLKGFNPVKRRLRKKKGPNPLKKKALFGVPQKMRRNLRKGFESRRSVVK